MRVSSPYIALAARDRTFGTLGRPRLPLAAGSPPTAPLGIVAAALAGITEAALGLA